MGPNSGNQSSWSSARWRTTVRKPSFVFGGIGAILWAITGFVAGMAWYAPAGGWPDPKQDKATATAALDAIWSAMLETCVCWMAIGAVYGLIVLTMYRSQPRHARYTAARNPMGGPKQSLAEIAVTIRAAPLAVVLGLLAAWVNPDLVANGQVMANTLPPRLLMGAIMAFGGGLAVLPFSLKLVGHLSRNMAFFRDGASLVQYQST